MATLLKSANFNGTNGSKFFIDLSYDIADTDIANNKTNIRLYLDFRSTGNYSGSGSTYTGYINGKSVGTGTSIGVNQTKRIGQLDIVVNHENDGKGSLSYNANLNTPWTLGNASLNGTKELPTIPRASTVTATDANIGSATSINISRASSGFTHILKYSFGSLSGTIATGVGTSYGWTLPTSFYAQISNAKSGICTITCETYNGSTLIGTKTTTFKVNVDEISNKPTVSATITDTNAKAIALTGDSKKIIKFLSNPRIVMTATAKNSATISNRKITCGDGKISTNADVTFNAVESGNFTVSATDSRGFTNSITYKQSIIEYIVLTLNLNFYRPQPTTGEIVLTFNGNYFNSNFGTTSNTLVLKYRFREKGVTTWGNYINLTPVINSNTYSNGNTAISLGSNFDYTKSYEFEIVATDKVNDTGLILKKTVTQGLPIMDLGEKDMSVNGDLSVFGKLKSSATTVAEPSPNLDAYLESGSYYFGTGFTPTNPPIGSTGYLIVHRTPEGAPNNRIWQIWLRAGTMNSNESIWYRFGDHGAKTFGNWYPITPNVIAKTDASLRYQVGTVLKQSGYIIMTPTANTPTSAVITFPTPFVGTPNIQLSVGTTTPGTQVTGVGHAAETPTGFQIFLTRTNTTNTYVYWTAEHTIL